MVKYYADETEQRRRYFETQFFTLLRRLASTSGVSINSLLRQIKDLKSFQELLIASFSVDTSLAFYVEHMSPEEIQLFFERKKIQEIVKDNEAEEEPLTKEEQKQIPIFVKQVDKKTREFFTVTVKGKRTRGYKDTIKIRGKKRTIFRDQFGRFSKRT